MKKKLSYLVLACLPLIVGATNNNLNKSKDCTPSSVTTSSFDIGPVMCTTRPNQPNTFYTFYVPVTNANIYSLRYEWRVSPSNVVYDYESGNSIGIKFTQNGSYLIWVDVYDQQGNKKSASMSAEISY
ncbi:hypothetical protein KSZ12_10080 [Parabacteroides distasonis]|uniref:hypothetical protein n=1 Tax=Parabacteroides distasonis TaxID=823 RepID=UPI001C37EF23|nr:hypothetical protein [Parabacteroides distasonis]MBV4226195.1 hypothetical protein [Parabacteroides distasonis]